MAWYHSIYTDEDLVKNYQSFEKEYKHGNCGKVLLRLLMVTIMSSSVAFVCISWNWMRLTQFLTNWVLVLTLLWVFLSTYISVVRSAGNGVRALHHILF